MEKIIVRWEATAVNSKTTRYALRTAPKGQGEEIGAYSSWNNARAEDASESVVAAIEQKAREKGYFVDFETSWNDTY